MGLKIERYFSDAVVHPFDTVEWEIRDAFIANHKGEAVFEQKGVEFPKGWSQLAVNVVASKYFYGDLAAGNGSPAEGKREWSLKQLAGRVAYTIAKSAVEQGHIEPTCEDIFQNELVWLIIHQHFAFNSPVWFNVGLFEKHGIRASKPDDKIYGWVDNLNDFDTRTTIIRPGVTKVDPYVRPQASACFILNIDDSIEDIWKRVHESARLFKFGSGVGADWSKLRSTKDILSGGGNPSGPVSFMRVQDATGGTIKSGGKTRRAAIMQTLKVWHPDIEEFVTAKQEEEKKAWALIDAGYDGSFNGPAYGSVAFQNVNQSVRVTDEFMKKLYDLDGTYNLKSPATGEVLGTANAGELLRKIAEGTHICGDPGVQFEDTIQKWHTCKASGPINSSNPCSEYMFLDDSACNLASLNLRKFQKEDGSFDVDKFIRAVRLIILAMEVLVDLSGYPSAAIAQNSHDFRPLGLGYANLGALLMSMGIPYDSEQGRSIAGAIGAIMFFAALDQSALEAAVVGPFPRFKENRENYLDVVELHTVHIRPWDEVPSFTAYLWQAARRIAEKAYENVCSYGARNSQLTVLAPTGTIAFMMDCDTTGIEPDIALVKYKLLAGKGEGQMKIVNQSVEEALLRLGYNDWDVAEILNYIDENDTIEGAPGLKPEHLPIFDCAFKPFKGERSIHYMGHIKMMAAAQPFLSGAISKTVNMPETATVEEISQAYVEGWKLGLKALAIYRENSKRSQPLSTTKGGNTKNTEEKIVERVVEKVVYRPERKRLPDTIEGPRHKFSIGGHEGYFHVGLYPDTMMPGELFINMSKKGSTVNGLMDAFATSISIALQYGVPLADLIAKFRRTRFEPAGFTSNPNIRSATSVLDYIFRWLEGEYLEEEEEEDSFVAMVVEEKADAIARSGSAKRAQITVNERVQSDGSMCPNCGNPTIPTGSCNTCTSCGTTTGCG